MLPLRIGPQRFENGSYIPLFPSVDRVTVELSPGAEVTASFDGDLFEMEDQRYWTDAPFKTYSTPLAYGFPQDVELGREIRQSVAISTTGVPSTAANQGAPPRLTFGGATEKKLPSVGLGLPSDGVTHSSREFESARHGLSSVSRAGRPERAAQRPDRRL